MCHNCQKEYFQQKIESPPPPRSTSWPSARRLVLLVLVPRELQLHPLLQGVHGVDRALHAAHCSNSKLACINSIAREWFFLQTEKYCRTPPPSRSRRSFRVSPTWSGRAAAAHEAHCSPSTRSHSQPPDGASACPASGWSGLHFLAGPACA